MAASRTGNVEAMKVLLDHGADVNAKETFRGTTPLMWAADEAHAPAVQLLIQRGANINARSNPAARGRGPALGKANDPRRAVAAQGAALAAGQALDLAAIRAATEGNAAGQAPAGQAPAGQAAGGQRGGAGQRGAAGGQRGAACRGGAGTAVAAADAGDGDQNDDAAVAAGFFRRPEPIDGGELTALIYAARSN